MATGRRRWQGGQDVAPFLAEDLSERRHQYGVGRPTEPLQTLDTSGRVIYVGSFSKTMLPALRLGFVVTPPSLSAALSAAKYVTDWHTSLPLQGAMADFIGHGWFARHVRKVRAVYEARHQKIVDTLHHAFGISRSSHRRTGCTSARWRAMHRPNRYGRC